MVEKLSSITIPENIPYVRIPLFRRIPEKLTRATPAFKSSLKINVPEVLSSPLFFTAIAKPKTYSSPRDLHPHRYGKSSQKLLLAVGLDKQKMANELADFLKDVGRPAKVIDKSYLNRLKRLRLLVEFPEFAVVSIPNQGSEGIIFDHFFPVMGKPSESRKLMVPDNARYLRMISATFYQAPLR